MVSRFYSFQKMVVCCLISFFVPVTFAQEMPPAPVGVTEAREFAMRQAIKMSGTVRGRLESTVAAEVAGAVERLYVDEGSIIEKDQPLLVLRTAAIQFRIEAVEATLADLEARLKQATVDLKRARGLFEAKVISDQERDQALYQYQSLEGQRGNAAAQLKEAKLALNRATVRAPFNGVVVLKHVQPGEWVAAGGPTFDLISVDDLEVVVDVPERYFSMLSKGDKASVMFPALDNLTLGGSILALIPRAGATRTLPVRVGFATRGKRVPAGILANVDFRIGESYSATIVPKDAVLTEGNASRVFVVTPEGTAAPVSVTVGAGAGNWIEVRGIDPGQQVVSLGNERLFPGQAVQASAREYELP